MVNVEKFAERLKNVMDYYDLSAAILASKIDVQRSSISHILSGRNKPSLEFVLKVLKAFPEVELYWLLNGTGSFPKKIITPTPTPTNTNNQVEKSKLLELNSGQEKISQSMTSDIERIVVFYKDGTFKNYTP